MSKPASLAAGNKDTSPAKRLPAKSLTSVLTNTVNKVLGGKVKGLEGIKVAVFAPMDKLWCLLMEMPHF